MTSEGRFEDSLSWILSALSTEQREPLRRSAPNACILAAAGSGKTRTLVHLLAADVASGISPPSIVAFTFTEKAGEELSARIHALVRKNLPEINLAGMYIGTIHAWCFQYLASQPAFYNFLPLDELHLDALVSRLYDALGLQGVYGKAFPKAIEPLLADLELFYNENLNLEQVPARIRPCIEKFLDILHRNRLLTFGGMIRHATEYLRAHGPVSGLRSLYVDEYQDVNPAQVALIKAMLPTEGKVVVVGDELQCIYNWRGSDVSRILNFSSEFGNSSVHRLSTNHRSRPPIVQLATGVATTVTLRDAEKVMKSGRRDTHCKNVHWLSVLSDAEQAEAVVAIVKRFAAKGVTWSKMAVLLRSVLGSGKPIVEALSAEGIPVQCPLLSRGGEFINGFLVPIFDWLRTEHTDPRNEIEEAESEKVAQQLWQAVRGWMLSSTSEQMFWNGINGWLEAIVARRANAYDVRGRLYDLMNVCGVRLAASDHGLIVGLGIGSQIIRTVEEIHRRRLADQERRTPRGLMSEVYFALVRKQDDYGESGPIDSAFDGVVVTTVHQAKGLEWPIVILPMLVKRRFPVAPRPHATSYPDEMASRYGTSIDDERRLFYVAVTRTRERLFLLDPVAGNEKKRSPFLQDLEGRGLIRRTTLSEIDGTVWRIEMEDLTDSDPPPLRIALSDLLLYLECPYEFGLRRRAGIQASVGEELGFGKGLHEVIQRRIEDKKGWTAQKLKAEVEEHVNLPLMSERGEADARKVIVERTHKLERLGAFEGSAESEVVVEVLLNGGIVHGIIDGIQLREDGSILVRDWKSNVHAPFLPRYERQLQFYAYALRLQGKRISSAEIVDVAASSERNTLMARNVDIGETAINKLVEGLDRALTGIATSEFAARPSPSNCAACDMYRICAERHENET